MHKLYWSEMSTQLLSFIETEEWVQVPMEKKQKILEDLRDPTNMLGMLRFRPGCDMISFKIYRPDGLTKMAKFTTWVFIPGISELIAKESEIGGRKSE